MQLNWLNVKIIGFPNGKYTVRRGYFGMYSYRSLDERYWWSIEHATKYSMSEDKARIFNIYCAVRHPSRTSNPWRLGQDVTKDFKLSVAEDRLNGVALENRSRC